MFLLVRREIGTVGLQFYQFDNMIQTESFLHEMLCIREGVFECRQESDFLSRSQVDDIISFLSCE